LEVRKIRIEDIEFDENQPRKDIAKIGELAESILKEGLIQPLEVQDLGNGRYRLIDGERRLRALKLIKKEEVECIVKRRVKNAFVRQVIGDFQKEKLNLVEQSNAIVKLEEEGYDRRQIMHLLGIKNTKYATLKKIQGLNDNTKELIIAGKITANVIHNLTKHELASSKEDEIMQDIVRNRRTSQYQIDKTVLERQNIRYVINRYLSDSYVFEKKTEEVNVRLRDDDKVIDMETRNALKSNDGNLRRELETLRNRIDAVLDLMKKRAEQITAEAA